ncbi:MAG: DMT family transporter [Rubrivivax sp.]|nr:DMT family transporter [Rubrivivax sp.]MDP3612487.1 DMT family transporter [Rubrivivax sp.]
MSFAAQVPASGKARLLLWLVPLLWSSNYIIARLGDGVIAPHALALGRWSLAALILLPWMGRGLWSRRDVVRREWLHLLVLGFLGMYICGAWVYVAGHTTTSTNIALIYAVTPMAIAAASAMLLHEKLSRAQWAGVVLALLGLLFVIAKGDPARLLAVQFVAGDAWITAAAISWTAYSVLLKRWPSALGPGERLVAIIGGGLLVLLPTTVAEALVTTTPAFGWGAAGLVLLAAVLPGVLSYGAYSYLQRELGASRTAMMLYLAPVYGALLAWLVLGEVPGWYHVVGAAMILPSIWLASRK